MKKLIFCSLILLTICSCHEKNKNKISPAELMKSREIKKVSEAEILKEGTVMGDEIRTSLEVIISNQLGSDSSDCNFENWAAMDSIEFTYQSDIRKVNVKSEIKSDLEYQLLEAYQYNLENNLSATPAVQKLDQSTVLFTYPVTKESAVFKYCLDSTSRLSAEMWVIRMPIKEIVNRL